MRTLGRLSLAIFLVGNTHVALTEATSLDDSLATDVMTPKSALLGPIDSVGRKSWDCQPERAASTPRAQEAELPM